MLLDNRNVVYNGFYDDGNAKCSMKVKRANSFPKLVRGTLWINIAPIHKKYGYFN
jgi:hypothetical protein